MQQHIQIGPKHPKRREEERKEGGRKKKDREKKYVNKYCEKN